MTSTRLILLLALATTGCQLHGRKQEVKYVEPVLPTTISLEELVEFLNGKTNGLNRWRCMNTQVHVKSRDLPFPQKLKGQLACEAPSQFRLVCDNTIGHADLGANDEICWAYVKPGESVVMKWRHEESDILQHMPAGIPKLEPEWLMTILGVQPLDPNEYSLQNAPVGSREVWLAAIEDAPDGTSLRRVIKIDTVRGVVRRHALYDKFNEPLLIADLSDYKACGGHELPHSVQIEFPATETQLTLKFTGIETECVIPEGLWQPPTGKNIQVVDLGDMMRTRMQQDPAFAREIALRQKNSDSGKKTAQTPEQPSLLDGNPNNFPGGKSAGSSFHEPPVRPTGNSQFYGADPESADPDLTLPDSEYVDPDSFSDTDLSMPMDAESSVPDFDTVAPAHPGKKRFRWFSFGRQPRD